MSYELQFHKGALQEWKHLDPTIRRQFANVLARRLQQPHVPSARLRADGLKLYKIKLRQSGYRLVYQVFDDVLVVLVLAAGKRDKDLVYRAAGARMTHP